MLNMENVSRLFNSDDGIPQRTPLMFNSEISIFADNMMLYILPNNLPT